MTLDLIIISHAKTPELKAITQRGIYSALGNEGKVKIQPIVVEGNHAIQYDGAKTFYQYCDFNYNSFLNYGATKGNGEYIAFCNNDLTYSHYWASELIQTLELGYDSVSPYSPDSHKAHNTGILPDTGLHEGMRVKHEFEGWCFVWRRELWQSMRLDERVKFWCSDDATVEQLKAAGKRHTLDSDVFVYHHDNGGKTLNTLKMWQRCEYTTIQAKIFNQLYDKNVENVGKG